MSVEKFPSRPTQEINEAVASEHAAAEEASAIEPANEAKALRERIEQKYQYAFDHALDLDTESDFIQRYADLLDESHQTNVESEELLAMEARVKQGIMLADTLTEFRLAMERVGIPHDAIRDALEHENAHMNVAEQEAENVDIHGYGVALFKEGGVLASAQPMILHERKVDADQLAALLSSLRVTHAPDQYGHRMSEDDARELGMLRSRIEEQVQQSIDTGSDPEVIRQKLAEYEAKMAQSLVADTPPIPTAARLSAIPIRVSSSERFKHSGQEADRQSALNDLRKDLLKPQDTNLDTEN